MVETDRHVVCLENREHREDVVPGLRNLKSEVGKHVDADKHHIEACALRQTVGRAVERDRNGGRLIELADGVVKALVIVERENRTADCIVDDIYAAAAEEGIGPLSGKDRRKQRTCRNEFDVDADLSIGRKVVGDEVLQDLRLVTAFGRPDFD